MDVTEFSEMFYQEPPKTLRKIFRVFPVEAFPLEGYFLTGIFLVKSILTNIHTYRSQLYLLSITEKGTYVCVLAPFSIRHPELWVQVQGCQILLGTTYQNWKNIPK
jgi:hypothetical protein